MSSTDRFYGKYTKECLRPSRESTDTEVAVFSLITEIRRGATYEELLEICSDEDKIKFALDRA